MSPGSLYGVAKPINTMDGTVTFVFRDVYPREIFFRYQIFDSFTLRALIYSLTPLTYNVNSNFMS